MRALIFDVDGTLAETEMLHLAAFNATFRDFGLDWHWSEADYQHLLATTGGKERMARFVRERGAVPDPDQIAAIYKEKTRRYAEMMAAGQIGLRPGVAELIAAARADGLRLAVATTTAPGNVDALIRACMGQPADRVFDVIAAGDMVAAKKPAPDVYLLAMDRLGLGPQDCVAFEDSRNGVLSAQAAGLPVVLTRAHFTQAENIPPVPLELHSLADLGGLEALRDLTVRAR